MDLKKIKRHVEACGILHLLGATGFLLVGFGGFYNPEAVGLSGQISKVVILILIGIGLLVLGIGVLFKKKIAMIISAVLISIVALASLGLNIITDAIAIYYIWSYYTYYKIQKS
ncbi:MAG: hypothetical protein A2Y24_08415 [Clostridiales bacterium GWE2_32_10]|nr:MAG: hypothetical protein A2Y24_08415 [Clostridiales bacterium GWE2_32_10]HBY21126.1 hypothetical protein [Clostridiales bacterium]